jgi:hypothetical protein
MFETFIEKCKSFIHKSVLVIFGLIVVITVLSLASGFYDDYQLAEQKDRDEKELNEWTEDLYAADSRAREGDFEKLIEVLLPGRNEKKEIQDVLDSFLMIRMVKSRENSVLSSLELLSNSIDMLEVSDSDIDRLVSLCEWVKANDECEEIVSALSDDEYKERLISPYASNAIKNDPRSESMLAEIEYEKQRKAFLNRKERQVSIIMARNKYMTRHEAEQFQRALEQMRELRCSQGAELYGIPPNVNAYFPRGLLFTCP